MDVTTLLGTLLAALLDGGARVVVHAVGYPPGWLIGDALAGGRGALVVGAVVAWLAAVLLVLVAASDGGPAGAPARGLPHPVAPLPPRRVRATGDAASAGPAPAAPVEVVRPRSSAATPLPAAGPVPATAPVAPAPALIERPVPAPVPARSVAARAAAPTGSAVVLVRTAAAAGTPTGVPTGPALAAVDQPPTVPARAVAPTGSAAATGTAPITAPTQRPHGVDHRHGPAPCPSAAPGLGRTPRPPDGPRCRRCTQPRCWPSTGERPAAQVPGSGAPRACRTSLTAGTAHRCASADPWRTRCAAAPPHLTVRGPR